jgi:hypothetical protein
MLQRVVFLLLTGMMAWGQDPRGFVFGTVSDASGAVVPGASVALTHVRTGVTTRLTTNGEGIYEGNYLAAGEYSLAVEYTGFKSFHRSGIDLRIGDRLRVDAVLQPGSAGERIEVSAESPVLETATATVGQVIDRKILENMPMRSGNVSWLYGLTAGTTLSSLPFDGPWNIDQSSAVRVGGTGLGGVDYNVDGVSNNAYGGGRHSRRRRTWWTRCGSIRTATTRRWGIRREGRLTSR